MSVDREPEWKESTKWTESTQVDGVRLARSQRRIRALAELRRRQVVDEAALTPTERLQQAEELLALSWSLHGPPPDERWSIFAARRAKRIGADGVHEVDGVRGGPRSPVGTE